MPQKKRPLARHTPPKAPKKAKESVLRAARRARHMAGGCNFCSAAVKFITEAYSNESGLHIRFCDRCLDSLKEQTR